MEKNNCIINGHQYGLWQIENENEVSRTCLTCEQKQTYPMSSDTLKEIKKQQEANKLLTSFLNIPNYDNNLIGYLNIILDDVLNYINTEKKSLLVTKLAELTANSTLSEENKTLFERITTSIKSNNQEELFDTIEYFKIYNNDILTTPPIQEQTNLIK